MFRFSKVATFILKENVSFLAAALRGAERSDDPNSKHQHSGSGPVRSKAHGPQRSETHREKEERPVQEAHCRNRWGNVTFGH